MSVYAEERRADRAADAEQRRIDAAAAEARRVEREKAADERAARLAEQRRSDRVRAREERARVRAERRSARGEVLTAGNVYRKGTLALVTASALGSLPAQVLHFVDISPMLLPLPLAIEGAAWVMAAGVAYADERHLPGWVRWFLRLLVVAAAGFAASINYTYGTHLPGLSETDRQAAGVGLAAVTLLGPVLFEIRQWVSTLSADTNSPEERARRRHDRKRRQQHRAIAQLADRFVSAAPFGQLDFETAFAHAWEIETGTDTPGMTPRLHQRAARSAAALARAQHPVTTPAPRTGWSILRLLGRRPVDLPTATPNQDESTSIAMNRSTSDLGEPAPAQVATAPAPAALEAAPKVGLAKPAEPTESAVKARPVRPVPPAARSARPNRTADQLLNEARELTQHWPIEDLTAEGIRKGVRTSAAKARTLRDTLLAERGLGVRMAGEAAA
ncbi:hypothetical protein [Streptomyces cyaneofuscatus]|uniref:hypothetical protein n=1 Tax=Streptomyces cyaneofuscatus TaxID=66883 RepID=UPI0033AFCFBC